MRKIVINGTIFFLIGTGLYNSLMQYVGECPEEIYRNICSYSLSESGQQRPNFPLTTEPTFVSTSTSSPAVNFDFIKKL